MAVTVGCIRYDRAVSYDFFSLYTMTHNSSPGLFCVSDEQQPLNGGLLALANPTTICRVVEHIFPAHLTAAVTTSLLVTLDRLDNSTPPRGVAPLPAVGCGDRVVAAHHVDVHLDEFFQIHLLGPALQPSTSNGETMYNTWGEEDKSPA